MVTETFERLFQMNKDANPFYEWQKLSMEYYQQFSKQQLASMAKLLSRFTSQAKRLSAIKNPDDILKMQQEIFNEIMHDNIQLSEDFLHLSLESLEHLNKIVTSSTASAAKEGKDFIKKHKKSKASKAQ